MTVGFRSFVRRMQGAEAPTVQMLCLSLLFLLGAAGGYAYAGYCGDHAQLMLSEYLTGYCELFQRGVESAVPLLTAVRLYYGAVVLSFLFGFTAIGTLAVPALAGAFGFTSMFAIACFVQVYGRQGAVLALGALGVRLVFTLPCFLWLGSYAWRAASSLLPWPRGKRCAPVLYDGSCFYRLFVCVVLLMIGVCFERYITPNLFHLALGVLTEPVLAG